MIGLHVYLSVYYIFLLGTSSRMVLCEKRAKRGADSVFHAKKDNASNMYFQYLFLL